MGRWSSTQDERESWRDTQETETKQALEEEFLCSAAPEAFSKFIGYKSWTETFLVWPLGNQSRHFPEKPKRLYMPRFYKRCGFCYHEASEVALMIACRRFFSQYHIVNIFFFCKFSIKQIIHVEIFAMQKNIYQFNLERVGGTENYPCQSKKNEPAKLSLRDRPHNCDHYLLCVMEAPASPTQGGLKHI